MRVESSSPGAEDECFWSCALGGKRFPIDLQCVEQLVGYTPLSGFAEIIRQPSRFLSRLRCCALEIERE